MPLPRAVAHFNRVATNRLTVHVAPWAPSFGLLTHVGRRSGRIYRVPVNVWPDGDGFAVALTYGPDSDWVRNVFAAGGCELETRRRHHRLVNPRIVHDESRARLPAVPRAITGLVGVADFLLLDPAP
jgi:deazaflavin-dependent oxidoreductase (nitroreductase family)